MLKVRHAQYSSSQSTNFHCITVAVRIRPSEEAVHAASPFGHKKKGRHDSVWQCHRDSNTVVSTEMALPGRPSQFAFDRMLGPELSTNQVFKSWAQLRIDAVRKGRHSTLLTFGPTASGKTHTMQGDEKQEGIIQQAAQHLLSFEYEDAHAELRMQYVEVFKEQVFDLLDADQGNELKVAPGENLIATCHKVKSKEDVCTLLREGNAQRRTAYTLHNEKSSRSHAIVRFTYQVTRSLDGKHRRSVLNLVDLAGSEDSPFTGALESKDKERGSGKPSQNHLALSRVIHCLSLPSNKRAKYLENRESKLAHILLPHLSGKAYLSVLCCISAERQFAQATRSALKLSLSAKRIKLCSDVKEISKKKFITSISSCKPANVQVAHLNNKSTDEQDHSDDSSQRVLSDDVQGLSARGDIHVPAQTDCWKSAQPPLIEVMVDGMLENAQTCLTVDDTRQHCSFLTHKLKATDELVEALFQELQSKQNPSNRGNQERTIPEGLNKNTVENEDLQDAIKRIRICKVVMTLGIVCCACGLSDLFMVTVFFSWFCLIGISR